MDVPVFTVELRREGFDDPIIGNGMSSSTVSDVVEQLIVRAWERSDEQVLISVSEQLEDYDIINEESKKVISPKTLLGIINRNPLRLLRGGGGEG